MSKLNHSIFLEPHLINDYLSQRFLFALKLSYQRGVWFLLVGLLLGFGAYLRLDQFLFNRSLWLDEAFIANQVARGDWVSFFNLPMEYSHFVPPMFAVMGKLFVVIFGDNDLSLRIYPQICSLLSLGLFYLLARRLISPWATLVSLGLFAISPTLIFHASNLKQYSSDVMLTLALFWAFTYLPSSDQKSFNTSLVLFALLGIIVVWFSHPSLFILASLGLFQGIYYLGQKNWSAALKLMAVGSLWVGSFAILYFIVNGGNARESSPIAPWLFKFWHVYNQAFMPSLTNGGFPWITEVFALFFRESGFKSPVFVSVLMLFGMVVLFKQQRRLLSLLLLPIGITLLASHFEQYVFSGRLILFLLPLTLIFIGVGVTQFSVLLRQLQNIPYLKGCLGGIFITILMTSTIKFPLHKTVQVEESKPALAYLQRHQQPNDIFYIYHWAEPAFHYYAPLYGFNYESCGHITPPETKKPDFKEVDFYWSQKTNKLIQEIDNAECILGFSEGGESVPELSQLKGHGRIWFFFAHISKEQRKRATDYFSTFGMLLDEQIYPGTSLYLFDMKSDSEHITAPTNKEK